MSLINQMLKDLEKRARPLHAPERALTGLLASPLRLKNKNNMDRLVFILLIFAILSFLFILVHKYFTPTHHKNFSSVSQKKLLTLNSKKDVNKFVTPPVIMTGITLQSEGPVASMRFLLDKQVFYRVYQDQKNNLILTLENTQLIASLPTLNKLTHFIKDIKIVNQSDGNLKVIFSLSNTTKLSHISLNNEGKLPELYLELINTNIGNTFKKLAPLPIAIETHKAVKTNRNDLDLSSQYAQALLFLKKGRASEAITVLTELLNNNPDFSQARETLAKILIDQGDNDNAQAVIAEGLRLKPHRPSYVMMQAHILMNQNRLNDALQVLLVAPPSIQSNPNYYAFIAALYQRLGKSILSISIYKQLLTQQPTNATWWIGLGIALENVGNHNQALEAYQKANNNNLTVDLKSFVESRLNALA